jgi:exoribonuclease R
MDSYYRIINNKPFLEKNDEFIPTTLTKLFDGDLVVNDKLKYSKIRNQTLVGIFSTSQTQNFGKKNKTTYYKVKTLLNNIPDFIVGYSGKKKGKIIIIFKFLKWEKIIPTGTIIDVIGDYSEDNLYTTLLHHYEIYPKKFKTIQSINKLEKNIKRNILDRINIITIDPENSTDRDDGLSIVEDDKFTYIGIHIAQPIVYLDKNIIKKVSEKKFSTLYFNNTNKNLWGNGITELSSLSEKTKKYAYSVIFKIHKETNRIIKTLDYPTIISNITNLTYQNTKNPVLNLLLKKSKLYDNTINNSKEMVSFWMTKANHYIGMKLKGKGLPYRVNKTVNIEILEIPDDKKEIFKNRLNESAYYSLDEFEHQTLKKHFYTHFSSPIRRIVDVFIHYYLTYNVKINFDIDKINFLDKQTKKFHRTLELKKKIDEVENKSELNAYLFQIKKPNIWEVYTKELGFVNMVLFNSKFDYQFNIIKKNDKFIIKNNNSSFEFKIGKLIKVIVEKTTNLIPQKSFKIIPKSIILN